jgi:hypothetical protein
MPFLGSTLKRSRRKLSTAVPIAEERPLSPEERALLSFVLTHTTPEAARFLDQLDETVVTGACECGCPTVGLRGPDRANELWPGPNPLVDLLGKTKDDRLVGLLVFANRRQLELLETYNLSESEEPWGLPTLSSLESMDGKRLMLSGSDA